jgi:GH18 family chitinase
MKSVGAYAYERKTETFIAFDNDQTMSRKIDFVLEKQLGGVMLWDLAGDIGAQDDLGRPSLLQIIKEKIMRDGRITEHTWNVAESGQYSPFCDINGSWSSGASQVKSTLATILWAPVVVSWGWVWFVFW